MKKLSAKVLIGALAVVLAVGMLALAGCSGSGGSGGSGTSGNPTNGESGGGSPGSTETTFTENSAGYYDAAEGPYASGIHHATVTVEGYDPFTIELDADAAPVTVANFCTLANGGYYDGLSFYRIVEGFCLQGGTLGNSTSGRDTSLTPIVGEFAGNGVANQLADHFKKGVVAMARTQDLNSGSSTFFVTLGSGASIERSLNRLYAAFGTIDNAGMAIVDKIVADFAQYAEEENMGVIGDEAHMPKITSIVIDD